MKLHADKTSPTIRALLGDVSLRMDADPSLVEVREPSAADRGRIVLVVQLPATYPRRTNPRATRMRCTFDNGGWLVELAECFGRVSCGWRYDCIPTGALGDFLTLWLTQSCPAQGDLFAS